MVTKGIYLFWDKKYEQVIYAGRFIGRKRIKTHFYPSQRHEQKINEYVQNHPDRIESVIFCEFDDISDNDLNQLEMETIKLLKLNKYRYPDSHVFNFTDGGEGNSGWTPSKETRKKISESLTGVTRSEETRKKMSESHSGENNLMYGENNPKAKYTLWDITKCNYNKHHMLRSGNDGKNPCRCFQTKYNCKKLPIGYNLDFYTPELINDLINEYLEAD